MIDAETLRNAIVLTQEGKFSEAEKIYTDLLERNANDFMLLSTVGLFYVSLTNYEKAELYLQKACEINETIGTVSALGFLEYERKNYHKAAEILERALNFGDSAEVYDRLILSLFKIKDYNKAVEYSAKMHEKYPDNTNSIANMVKSLTHTGKLLEAERLCAGYLKKDQSSSSLWFHLGFLKELIYSDDNQACQCYKIALDLGSKEAYYNIAVSYQKQGDFEQAEENYYKMLEYFPNSSDTISSLGMCKLAQKKFREGYELFFNRENARFKKMTKNPWQPNKGLEKEIVLVCDQGFGDHIQFIRYLPFLEEKSEKIYVAAHPYLKKLFQTNYPSAEYISYNEVNPNIQAVCVTDLPYILDIDFDKIPSAAGYLNAPVADITSNKLKVGLCWEAGAAGIRTMINRTINIRLLEPILNMENVQVYSFQVDDSMSGNERYPQMINLAKDFKDFYDTASAMKSMDLIISVDTAVAHLAGALGVKTLLLLPYSSDWRWFRDTQTTPWYDSVEIFKQTDPISWEEPLEGIICKLKEYFS